jgi:hypothetical protein
VPAHIERDRTAFRNLRDSLVPAAGMEARGMSQENRRLGARAFKNSQPHAVEIKKTGAGHTSRGTKYGSR